MGKKPSKTSSKTQLCFSHKNKLADIDPLGHHTKLFKTSEVVRPNGSLSKKKEAQQPGVWSNLLRVKICLFVILEGQTYSILPDELGMKMTSRIMNVDLAKRIYHDLGKKLIETHPISNTSFP